MKNRVAGNVSRTVFPREYDTKTLLPPVARTPADFVFESAAVVVTAIDERSNKTADISYCKTSAKQWKILRHKKKKLRI